MTSCSTTPRGAGPSIRLRWPARCPRTVTNMASGAILESRQGRPLRRDGRSDGCRARGQVLVAYVAGCDLCASKPMNESDAELLERTLARLVRILNDAC